MNKKKISALILSCVISSQIILPTLDASATELNNTNNKTIENSTSNLESVNSNEGSLKNKNQEITYNLNKQKNTENDSKKVKTKATNDLRTDEIVNIPDKNLKKALNKELKQNENSNITKKQLESLTSLDLSSNNISNLDGLQYCSNLNSLNLLFNNINDISTLQNLYNLNKLDLNYNQITNITPLKNLTNLNLLNLSHNQITDITPLKNLVNLNSLNLSHNQVSNIISLQGLHKLTYLSLSENKITDITPLKNLTKLSDLILNNNQIKNLSSLKELYELEYLTLNDNKIEDINHLKNLTKLTHLTLFSNEINDITHLKNLVELKELGLNDNNISDITPISNLKNLTSLTLANNQINDITPLHSLHLYYVTLSNQLITSTPIQTINGQGSVDNIIKGFNNEFISPNNISDNGVYDKSSNKIKWTNLNMINGVNYSFDHKVTIGIARGNFSGTVSMKVTNSINEKPVIHAENKTIKVGSKFNLMDGVSATDKEDGNITNKIKVVESTVNLSKPGTYKVVYEVTDSHDEKTRKTITVTVVSNEKPVINGIDNVTIKEGTVFNPMTGVTAKDTEDGTITNKVRVDGKVDTNKAGKYELTYTITDTDGNTTTVKRVVTVIANTENINEKPVIHAENKTIKVGSKFDLMDGISATDKEDGNITNKIKVVESTVNLSKPGTYKVVYEVIDSHDEKTRKTIIVTVVSDNKPISNESNDTTNNNKPTTNESTSTSNDKVTLPATGATSSLPLIGSILVGLGGLFASKKKNSKE
ncbi:immunoglobulin-like domain-containing protein [Clostridium baratii]|uniref:immunoglobulin-like domain-containing protein n=1 Tax=Clostridium baratii TaxID=1561 RepID=UPI0030CDB14F